MAKKTKVLSVTIPVEISDGIDKLTDAISTSSIKVPKSQVVTLLIRLGMEVFAEMQKSQDIKEEKETHGC